MVDKNTDSLVVIGSLRESSHEGKIREKEGEEWRERGETDMPRREALTNHNELRVKGVDLFFSSQLYTLWTLVIPVQPLTD